MALWGLYCTPDCVASAVPQFPLRLLQFQSDSLSTAKYVSSNSPLAENIAFIAFS